MKFSILAAIFLLAAFLSSARAQGTADDQYIVIYSLMQQADSLAAAGEPRQALSEYAEVQTELQKFQKVYPDWNPNIISFRMNYLARKIAALTAQIPVATHLPVAIAPTNSTSSGVKARANAELNSLRAQLQSLQADNATLGAKLKEALSEQPSVIDPRELAGAREKIRSLMKENDLLKAGAASAGVGGMVDPNALARTQADLAAAGKKLTAQTRRADRLASENESLQSRLNSLMASPAANEALREENALLKKELADLRWSETNSSAAPPLKAELQQAKLQITALQSQVEVASLEKAALENRVRQLQSSSKNVAAVPKILPVAPAPAVAPNQKENEARIRELTQERDDLLAKLGEANREIYGRKKQGVAAQMQQLDDEVKTLRARVAVDEAQAVPYTTDELALFKQAAPQLANPEAEKKSIRELPAGSAALVAEAQNYFAAKHYDQAEDDYLKILRHDENNGLVLANLAAIELEQGKLDEAEKHIDAALAKNPNDAYNLATLGYLKFRQGKYDDALNALSRAATLDPQNPEIENYLGVTLGHKGLRTQAETALRKAIQIDPNYGPAHNNLAVIYLTQNPPLVELARWHYEKALAAGHPRNPDLEKMLAEKGRPVNPQ
ncbi:MAG TPA: tetratricopeptide repeat protein [Verrucomicrobiae bacterium]